MKLNTLEKTILIAISALAVGTCVSKANIGDTYQKSCARYGQPWKTSAGLALWAIDRDNTVTESFGSDGRCDTIEYRRFSGVNYSPSELLTRISQNLPSGGGFKEVPVEVGRFWESSNGSTALLVVEDHEGQGRNPVMLSIWTLAHHQAVAAAEAAAKGAAEKTEVTSYN